MKINNYSLAAVFAAALASLAPSASADVITDWNLITLNATKTGGLNSNLGSRIDAIEAIAVYDGVNSIQQFGTPYHFYAPNTGSAQAAAARAAHDVLVNYFPAQQTALDAALANSLAGITDGPIGNGQTVGSLAAADIIALRANDGSAPNAVYTNTVTTPGAYQLTPNSPTVSSNFTFAAGINVKLLNDKTKIVSVAHVSNSLGTVNPVEQIIALAHARGVPVMIDGAQSTPHLPVNVTALDADFYTFSGHKVFGPTGIGALYGKMPLLEAMPPWQGGGHMIRDVRFEKTIYQNAPEKFEAGTPDIAGVVGLGAAIDYLFKVGIPAIAGYEHSLLEYGRSVLSTIPGLRPIGTAASKASVLSFVIPGISNEQIAKHLDQHGIAIRAGHHCAQPAIRHFGLETSVRPSLAFYNTREEIDALVLALRSLKRG